MSRILPRYQRTQLAEADSKKISKIIGDSTAPATNTTTNTSKHYSPTPADRRRLRGIPVAGAATGTTPGTDPLRVLLNKERRNG